MYNSKYRERDVGVQKELKIRLSDKMGGLKSTFDSLKDHHTTNQN